MRLALAAAGLVGLGGLGVLGGCGSPGSAPSCAHPSAFSLSLVSDTGGQPNPIAAATWFAGHNGGVVSPPADGWVVVHQETHSATVRSGAFSLHVVQGSDGTWQVDGGTHCA